MAMLAESGLIVAAYWLRFQRISPFAVARSSVRMCFIGAFFSIVAPFAAFGLSKITVASATNFKIEFGDAAWASAITLAISLFALKEFTQRYNLLWPERSRWTYPGEEP